MIQSKKKNTNETVNSKMSHCLVGCAAPVGPFSKRLQIDQIKEVYVDTHMFYYSLSKWMSTGLNVIPHLTFI